MAIDTRSGSVPAAAEVGRFGIHEVRLTASGDYSNPYQQVSATARFTGPNGETAEIPLFWDGGDEWAFRYAPETVGAWSWTIESNDSGLSGRSGTFDVTASSNKGGIQIIPDNPHHMQYQDSSPYYLAGDTQWGLMSDVPSEKYNETTFREYVDTRANQGFNYIHANVGHWPPNPGEINTNTGGKIWTEMGSLINPEFFKVVDERVEYLNDQGITAGLMLAWAQMWEQLDAAERLEYAQYFTARYGAYNVIFIVTGEYHETLTVSAYDAIGRTIADTDPHDRLITIHPTGHSEGSIERDYADADWQAFGDFQQLVNDDLYQRDFYQSILDVRDHDKPVVNSEYGYYESIYGSSLEETRENSWDIAMAGGYAITGFGSTFRSGTSYEGTFHVDNPRNDGWEDDIQHLFSFFKAQDFWELVPADDAISGGGVQHLLADWSDGDLIAYSRDNDGHITIDTGAMTAGTAAVQLYDPRTGAYSARGEVAVGQQLVLDVPDARDWVFVIDQTGTVGSGDGGGGTPPPPQELLIEAEDLTLSGGYYVESRASTSGGQVIRGGKQDMQASTVFDGAPGTYVLTVGYVDEDDGAGSLTLRINGTAIGTIRQDQTDTGWQYLEHAVDNVTLAPGDRITIEGDRHDGEMARVDYLTLAPLSGAFGDDPDVAAWHGSSPETDLLLA